MYEQHDFIAEKLIIFLYIVEKNEKKANIKRQPFYFANMMAIWAAITKAKNILAWQPTIKLEQGVESAVQWFAENRSWAKKIKL
jgi:nucleoside-diphosphate-sugar epimerase